MSLDVPLASVHFIWALGAISQIKRVPFSAELLAQQFPPPHTTATLFHAARSLGLHACWHASAASEIQRAPLPCLALLRSAPQEVAKASNDETPPHPERVIDRAGHSLGLVVKADAGRITLVEAEGRASVTLDAEAFSRRYAGELILFSQQPGLPADADAATDGKKAFGFAWFVPALWRHKRAWGGVLLSSLIIQAIGLVTPLLTQITVDRVIAHQTINTLIVIGAALGILLLFNAIMNWARQRLVLRAGTSVDAVLGTQVFDHLFRLPPRYFESRPTGVIVARLHGVETIREFLSGAAVTLLLDLPFLLLFVAAMFYYSWMLALLALAVLGAIVVLSLLAVPPLRKRLNEQFLQGARAQAFVTEYIAGMETVKSLQMEPRLCSRYADYLAAYLLAVRRTREFSNAYNVLANALEQLLTVLILVVGAWVVMQNAGFTVGMLIAFQMFAGRMSQPMLRLAGLWQEFQQAAIALKRLGDIMNAPAERASVIPARAASVQGEIAFVELSFRYAEDRPFLYRGFNCHVRPGACVALMGPSGSGKSTLAKLLQGFYLPNEGRITIDGHDIRHIAPNELRGYLGVVPQETVLFSGTIYENLIDANPMATFEQMIQACRWAEIHDTIEQLPLGYQQAIGEHGTGLSGGQKQRLAIARALLKRPKILVFDEAASSLDAPTAEQFARTINQLKGRVTMLYITHQLPKGLEVDEVVTLGSGET